MMSVVSKALVGMAMKLVTAKFIEEMAIYVMEYLSKKTESKADDKLVAVIKKHLEK